MSDVAVMRGRKRHAAIAGAAALCAAVMCVGAIGPWANTPVISFSGWAGIGLPLVVLAFFAFALAVLHGFVPRRGWLVLCMLIAAMNLVCAIVLAVLESLLSHAGNVLADLIARGTHRDLIASHPVSLGWGIPVLGVAAFALMLVSGVGLFGRYQRGVLPEALRERVNGRASPMPGAAVELREDDLFNTR